MSSSTVIAGYFLQYYCYSLFGVCAVLIQGVVLDSWLSSFFVLAGAYVVRPIGSIFFGRLSVSLGKERVLFLSLLLMGISTLLLGFLNQNALAPIFAVLVCIQGFAISGEQGGAITQLFEAKTEDRYFLICCVAAAAMIGPLGAALSGFWVEKLGVTWRYPFLIGGVLCLALSAWRYLSLGTEPRVSPARRVRKGRGRKRGGKQGPAGKHGTELQPTLLANKGMVLAAIALGFCSLVPIFVAIYLFNQVLSESFSLSASSIVSNELLCFLASVFFCFATYPFLKKFGERRLFFAAMIMLLTLIPLLGIALRTNNLPLLFVFQFFLVAIDAIQLIAILLVMPALFGKHERSFGVSLGFGVGASFAGIVPLAFAFAYEHFDPTWFLPLFLAVYCAFYLSVVWKSGCFTKFVNA